ncbi:protein of unknown function DUF214 [Methanohalobium evestigatum Z-7303]|uniref:ABC3 transporter permease protein domain-containing protein n=1 Tax=Methanohalobium evestigatum (strain ATCC BAA-1072 / DSM 3721 / NBRC 107634 / OCM 161 / Z-7303) TaxID=644295 RepID=D7E7W1_METEZ|nr:ABC transporter permease [Methanohalobium evestigatum]ADI73303.1 protein of unknown function DUF214 [Methanohalobium evestigatum Z-7303]
MYEFAIAFRHISSRRRHSIFSVLSVALAIAMIVVLMSMVSGFRIELIDSTTENSPHIIVNPESDDEFIHLYRHLDKIIKQHEGVVATSPYFEKQVALDYKDNSHGVKLKGVNPDAEMNVMHVDDDIIKGSFTDLSTIRNGIILGDKLAENLEVDLGERVDASSPVSGSVSFKVVGIMDTGTPKDETLAYSKLDDVQDFSDENDVVTGIGVRVQDIYQADNIAFYIEDNSAYEAESWLESNAEILELLNTQLVFSWILYTLIYITAGFGIANTLITVVMEKKREIGMLKAMGATRSSILLIFISESTILGTAGVLSGCILGYLLAALIDAYSIQIPSEVYLGLTTLPVNIEIMNFVYATVFAFIINIIAGVYPANRAAKLDPVDAIENA